MPSFGDYDPKEKIMKVTQICVSIFCYLSLLSPAYAAAHSPALQLPPTLALPDGLWLILALSGGISCAFIFTSIVVILSTKRAARRSLKMIQANFSEKLRHYEWLLEETEQCLLIWENPTDLPRITGNVPVLEKAGINQKNFQYFELWLEETSAQQLEQALTRLRYNSCPFELSITAKHKILLQVTGVIAGTAAIARFQNISAQQNENSRLQKDFTRIFAKLKIQENLLDHIQEPVWIQDGEGKICFMNRIFREMTTTQEGNNDLISLFNGATQRETDKKEAVFQDYIHTVIGGERRYFHLTRIMTEEGTATFARDESTYKNLANEIKHILKSHYETLDQISTAVAIFDANQKLKFCNHAFKVLWPLESTFLENEPSHTLFLERLREEGLIGEHPDWRAWKEELFRASQQTEPNQQIWNLPDGRTVHVISRPHPQGGITWLYENLTEKIDLERRYNTLIKIQGETLDKLSEGVVVFGADGRLRLSNPALSKLWSLPYNLLVEGIHITQLQAHCSTLMIGKEWDKFAQFVTGFSEKRDTCSGRIDLKNGTIIDYTLVPLLDGQTMLTFVNVTDTVHIARALQEKNEALESADRLRNEFVQHVSYELRTPLTNIIGFSDILRDQIFGSINERQHEYLGYIHSESGTLLNIVNDILDLATLDAGIMELNIKPVDIAEAMAQAAARVEERLNGRHIVLLQKISPSLNFIFSDAMRLHQIFVNILSNAANFATEGSTIEFHADMQGDDIVFSVHNEGSDIPNDVLDRIFKRFSSHAHHGGRAGAGLGLSLVKSFVELHNGRVEILTGTGQGTTVKCFFPGQKENKVF
ncbi:sensor histidine kinase protein [Bartonella australis AUST/NH1]|uniref:histidine kinase n=1 Tax=Bartonella australis (strain Aust/NH1) TaxID=1094489 RepID=M1P278_BARAA|nr:PAS domain-containing sensor histidine kinase [Bartonella australis]AGF73920.1 sensor histidine kinase protein [Bartonella australis AUST/NH1]